MSTIENRRRLRVTTNRWNSPMIDHRARRHLRTRNLFISLQDKNDNTKVIGGKTNDWNIPDKHRTRAFDQRCGYRDGWLESIHLKNTFIQGCFSSVQPLFSALLQWLFRNKRKVFPTDGKILLAMISLWYYKSINDDLSMPTTVVDVATARKKHSTKTWH